MKFRLHDSILVRTAIIIFAGLTVAQVIGLSIRDTDRDTALSSLEAYRIAERVATVTNLIDAVKPEIRPDLTKAMNEPPYRVTWGDRSITPATVPADAAAQQMAGLLTRRMKDGQARAIRVAIVDSDPGEFAAIQKILDESGDSSRATPYQLREILTDLVRGPDYSISVQLPDSSWLNFVVPFIETLSFWTGRTIAALFVSGLIVLALAVWAVRRLTEPLDTFAAAAERLGTDVNAPPLAESGPPDVRRAIHAFNEMQQRIRRFVEDRTRMLAAISHDLRTPITRLKLRAEFVESDEQRNKMLADLDEMETIVSSTLSFAREDANFEPNATVDLVDLLRHTCVDLADTGLAVTFRGRGAMIYSCRPMSLRRAFINLIDNAVKYGRRSRVDISLAPQAVIIEIDDDGPGVPEAEQERAFQPFYRLERSRNRESPRVPSWESRRQQELTGRS